MPHPDGTLTDDELRAESERLRRESELARAIAVEAGLHAEAMAKLSNDVISRSRRWNGTSGRRSNAG
jgi:hypothetical protein